MSKVALLIALLDDDASKYFEAEKLPRKISSDWKNIKLLGTASNEISLYSTFI